MKKKHNDTKRTTGVLTIAAIGALFIAITSLGSATTHEQYTVPDRMSENAQWLIERGYTVIEAEEEPLLTGPYAVEDRTSENAEWLDENDVAIVLNPASIDIASTPTSTGFYNVPDATSTNAQWLIDHDYAIATSVSIPTTSTYYETPDEDSANAEWLEERGFLTS